MTEDAKIYHYDFTKKVASKEPPLEVDESIQLNNVINLANFKKERDNKHLLSANVSVATGSDSEAKLAHFSALIQRGKTTTKIDSRQKNVLVPEHLLNNKNLQIDWSLRFGLRDFAYDKSGVRGTLIFNGDPFFVHLPWDSIWMILRQEEGMASSAAWLPDTQDS